jgi:diguanylate cyclase
VLRQAGSRLASSVRATDIIGRLGGDEFGIIPRGAITSRRAGFAAEKVRDVMRQPFTLRDGAVVEIGASVGFAISPHHGRTSVELLQWADAAMYANKRSRRSAIRV